VTAAAVWGIVGQLLAFGGFIAVLLLAIGIMRRV
jgi:hypothetical protein